MSSGKLTTIFHNQTSTYFPGYVDDNPPANTLDSIKFQFQEPWEYVNEQDTSEGLLKQKNNSEDGPQLRHIFTVAILVILEIFVLYGVIRSRLRLQYFCSGDEKLRTYMLLEGQSDKWIKPGEKYRCPSLSTLSPSLFGKNRSSKNDYNSSHQMKTASLSASWLRKITNGLVSKLGFSNGSNTFGVSKV